MALRVVYIDDEIMLSEIFQEMISCESISVKTFSDADKAIEDIRTNPPDIIFYDPFSYKADHALWTMDAFSRIFRKCGAAD